MRRRTFFWALALATLGGRAAEAQQPPGKVYRVGLVSIGTNPDPARPRVLWQSFLGAMRELEYVEGRNLVVRTAFADGRPERLADLVAEMLRAGVDVVVTTGTRETLAVKQAAGTTPIVMTVVPDPVGQGFVASLARPGGRITGLANLVPGVSQKYVELLKEAVPRAWRFAVIASPPNPVAENRRELEAAAVALGMTLLFVPIHSADDFDPALERTKKQGVDGIIATADAVTNRHQRVLAQAALKHRLPGIYWTREYAEEGGLMAYGVRFADLGRRAATYVDKILRGANPGDLPVEQPRTFELVINLKTARALGISIPQSLLLRADQVID